MSKTSWLRTCLRLPQASVSLCQPAAWFALAGHICLDCDQARHPRASRPSCTACTSANPQATSPCSRARRAGAATARACARSTCHACGAERCARKRASAASCTSPTSCDLNAWWTDGGWVYARASVRACVWVGTRLSGRRRHCPQGPHGRETVCRQLKGTHDLQGSAGSAESDDEGSELDPDGKSTR